jgi:hypothetical protein
VLRPFGRVPRSLQGTVRQTPDEPIAAKVHEGEVGLPLVGPGLVAG